MLAFDSGYFLRAWKHGFNDIDPAWTAAERATVNACAATIQGAFPGLMQIVAQQIMAAHTMLPFVQQDNTYMARWHLWLSRLGRTMKMFSSMQADLGTAGKRIGLRKACNLKVASQISALCEFDSNDKPRWVVSVNGNPKDPCCFFAAANAAKATRTLFHEFTHLYGTEDSGVMAIENAHSLEGLIGPRGASTLRRLLAKQRQFTLMGDVDRLPRGAVVNQSRMTAIFGPDQCWSAAAFAKQFTGDPVNGNVTRVSDGKLGNVSIVWDKNNKPLFYYNFK